MIKQNEEQEKRDALRQILFELCAEQDVLKKRLHYYFTELEHIYHVPGTSNNFRHYYSDIFAWLTMIDGDPSIGSLDVLAQNMQVIKERYIEHKNKDDVGAPISIKKEINKLYDHVNLEISRINHTKRITGETKSEVAKAKILIAGLDDKVKESSDKYEEVSKTLDSEVNRFSDEIHSNQKKMQNEYITILGIFAAIVLAFTGGMAFSSSVLENISDASIYRLIAIACIVGFVFFNLVWVLLDFIRNINKMPEDKKYGKQLAWWIVNIILIAGFIFACASCKVGLLDSEHKITQEIVQEQEALEAVSE